MYKKLLYIFVVLAGLSLMTLTPISVHAGVASDSYGEAPAGTGGGGGGAQACNGPDDGDQPDCSDGPTASAAGNPSGGGGGTPSTGPVKSNECSVVEGLGGNCDDQPTGAGINRLVVNIVRILSLIIGIIALLFIIIAGFKYVTSSGNEQKVTEAKRTLIYAMIGLGIAALAQILVNFAFTLANKV